MPARGRSDMPMRGQRTARCRGVVPERGMAVTRGGATPSHRGNRHHGEPDEPDHHHYQEHRVAPRFGRRAILAACRVEASEPVEQ